MDGLKRRLNESVQLKLSFTLSLAILVVAIVAGIFSFLSAFDEAHELQDDVLRQVAQLMDRQRLSPAPPTTDVRPKDVDEESRVIVQYLGEANPSEASVDAGGTLPLPTTLADGLHTLEIGGESFACWSKPRLPVNASRWRRKRASAMKLPAMARYAP
jgi:two-component system OmpR family sensor kinase